MNDRDAIDKRLREIFYNQLCLHDDQIHPLALLVDDLGCDSLDLVELFIVIEEEFKSELDGIIPDRDAEKFATYGDVLDYVVSGGKQLPQSRQ